MAENSENIEAKLCAYVEGDLDEQGRIEIERHLEAHPNHRRLLAELKATRDLLRYLPREPAPPELAETFNAHLERSALLDGPGAADDAGEPIMLRANLLPRLMAMAAIVLLAVGLGAVVYFALPRGESPVARTAPPADYAAGGLSDGRDSAAESDAARAEPAAKASPMDAAGPGERMGKIGPEDVAAAASEAAKHGGSVDAFAPGRGPQTGRADAASSPLAARARRMLGGGNYAPGEGPVYLLVSADDPTDALREVTSNLSSNAITWEPATEPAPEPVLPGPNQSVATSVRAKSSYAQVELSNALEKKKQQQLSYAQQRVGPRDQSQQVAQPPTQMDAPTHAPADRAAGNAQAPPAEQAAKNAGGRPAGSAEPDSNPPSATGAAPEQQQQRVAVAGGRPAPGAGPYRDNGAGPPPPVPFDDETPAAAEKAGGRGGNVPAPLADSRQAIAPEQVQTAAVADRAPAAEDGDLVAINAYGVTRRQVVELGRVLSRPARQVELIADDVELQVANETLRQTRNIADGADQAVAQMEPAARADRPDSVGSLAPPVAPAPAAAPALPQTRELAAVPPAAGPTVVKRDEVARLPKSSRPAGAAPAARAQAAQAGPSGAGKPATRPVAASEAEAVAGAPGAASEADADPAGLAGADKNFRVGPRPPVIRPGAKLSVTVDELAAPDREATTAGEVGPDGTLRLPLLTTPLRVSGLTPAQAERAIARAYTSSGLIDAATVTVDVFAAATQVAGARDEPATAPGSDARSSAPERLAATVPAPASAASVASSSPEAEADANTAGPAPAATRPTEFAAATTTPATTQSAAADPAAAEAAEERLDVVILVQRNAPPAPAAEPKFVPSDTQPVAPPEPPVEQPESAPEKSLP